MTTPTPVGYAELLSEIRERVRAARIRAALAVNSELIRLYWHIGREILSRQEALGWGVGVVSQLADDLRRDFPDMKGLGRTNLLYMRRLARAWPDEAIVQQLVEQLPWGHNIRLLERFTDPAERAWYARAAIEHGWSRAILDYQIDTDLYRRQGRGVTNFERTLPPAQSDLAAALLRDPYNFDFLSLAEDARERDVHRGLLQHLREFLIELGSGFAFVGSQVHLEVAGDDFYVDLLFYHLRLRSYVVIELKTNDFKPEYAGKLNFYLSAVDDLLRHPDDQPSIGLIICRGRKGLIAEYALRDMGKPIGIAGHRLRQGLPERLKGQLPTVEQLESELEGSLGRVLDGGPELES
ncbi:MAG: DUF1016 domain-containing protein [Methylococcus sp.]|nr:MAG: DUF1016 domain-containing protein [Methylococcus sp.]